MNIPAEDSRLMVRVACMYEDPDAALVLLKKAYAQNNRRLRYGGCGSISLSFVGLEDDLCTKRLANGVRRTLGLLQHALDTSPPTRNRVLGRPFDLPGIEVMRYQGYPEQ